MLPPPPPEEGGSVKVILRTLLTLLIPSDTTTVYETELPVEGVLSVTLLPDCPLTVMVRGSFSGSEVVTLIVTLCPRLTEDGALTLSIVGASLLRTLTENIAVV
jgi:hypothetical protein